MAKRKNVPVNPVAQKLRELARSREAKTWAAHGGGFTCLAVKSRCGEEVRNAYQEAFGLHYNYAELWNDPDCDEIRILLLCFAAAFADTGDL
jgi:hypothetical protein